MRQITVEFGELTEDYHFATFCCVAAGRKIYAQSNGNLWCIIIEDAINQVWSAFTSDIEPCFKELETITVNEETFFDVFNRISKGEEISAKTKLFGNADAVVAELNAGEKFTVNSILVTAQLIEATLDLQKNAGDKYCLVDKVNEYSANYPGSNNPKYSLNLQIACKDSQLYEYWENCLENNKLPGFEIITVNEFCNLYLRKLIRNYR